MNLEEHKGTKNMEKQRRRKDDLTIFYRARSFRQEDRPTLAGIPFSNMRAKRKPHCLSLIIID